MITLLHGDHIEASRAELQRLREAGAGADIRQLDGSSIDTQALTQALQSSSLFGGTTIVIIERLFGKLGRKTKLIEELCGIIAGAGQETDVILWEDKAVGATVLKYLGAKATVRLFAFPVVIFQFLDAIRPQNARAQLLAYGSLIAREAPELVFAMMTKRVRQLIQIAGGVTPEGMQGWQVSRLTTQAKSFTMDKLLSMYKGLLAMEYSVKTGRSPFTLAALVRQWIMEV